MDAPALAAYLDRIGAERPAVLDAAALRGLHLAHQTAVPFENLSIHLGEPISLGEDDLIAKIVTRRRGGFCYELNGAFALLLESLGAQVTRVADVAAVALHPEHDLFPADPERPGFHQRPDAHPDHPGRDPDRAAARYRRRAAG